MPASINANRPECRTSGRALSEIADAVHAHVQDLGVRAVGESLGVGKSTVQDWKGNLNAWEVAPFLKLARSEPSIRDAVLAYLDGVTPPEPQPTAAIPGALTAIERGADLLRVLADAIRDGRVDRDEDRAVAGASAALMEILPSIVRDIHAAATSRSR